MKPWKTLSSQMAFDHRWFKVRQDKVELPNGKVLDDYFVWVNGDVALVVPITEDGNIVIVKQYKHGADEILLELPAGFVDEGEEPLEAAQRELAEETGYISNAFTKLATMTNNPTKETGSMHIFLAEHSTKQRETAFDSNEEIETLVCTPQEVLEMIEKGEFKGTVSVVGVFMALLKLGVIVTSPEKG